MKPYENEDLDRIKQLILQLNKGKYAQNSALALVNKTALDSSDVMMILSNSKRTMARLRKNKTLIYTDLQGRYYYFWKDILPLLEDKVNGRGGDK